MKDTLHDFVYRVITEICYDREYIYAQFIRVFGEICEGIFQRGVSCPNMKLQIQGIKSGRQAEFEWSLLRRVDYLGRNEVRLTCRILGPGESVEHLSGVFELSQGERIS